MTPERLQNLKWSPACGRPRRAVRLCKRRAQRVAVFRFGMPWRQRQRQQQLILDQIRQSYPSVAGFQQLITVRPVLRPTCARPTQPQVRIHRVVQQSKTALASDTQAGLQPATHDRESAFLEYLQVNVDLTAGVRDCRTQARHAAQAQMARHRQWRVTRFRQVQKFRQAA